MNDLIAMRRLSARILLSALTDAMFMAVEGYQNPHCKHIYDRNRSRPTKKDVLDARRWLFDEQLDKHNTDTSLSTSTDSGGFTLSLVATYMDTTPEYLRLKAKSLVDFAYKAESSLSKEDIAVLLREQQTLNLKKLEELKPLK